MSGNKHNTQDGETTTTYDNEAYTSSPDDVKIGVNPASDLATTEKVPEKPTEIDTRFGFGPFKPRRLQWLNHMWFICAWMFLISWLEGFAVNGIANAGLPSIERQFRLTSSKSAIIPTSQDIGALVVVLAVSFVGARYNKLVWVAAGSLIMAVGSFIFIIPHLAERYTYQGMSTSGPQDTCNSGGGAGPGPSCDSSGEKYIGVFSLAQVIHGIGYTPMFTLGTAFLDDNNDPATAAIYIGICFAAPTIGVASGFFSGGSILQNFFVDFDRVDQDTLGFDARDMRWVGAWWYGFVYTTAGFVIVALPLFGYPKYMPGNKNAEAVEKKLQEENKLSQVDLAKELVITFLKAILKLIRNPTFMCITLAGCCQSLIIFGISSFSFKYFVEMYSMTFDDAGDLLGALILVGSVGMFLGGVIIRVFGLEMVGMLWWSAGATLMSGLLAIAYVAYCPEVKLAGMEVTYPNKSIIDGFADDCHGDCGCDGMGFNPVCGKDGIVYYSACHAGCKVAAEGALGSYTNCSCVATSLGIPDDGGATATIGRCDDGCINLWVLGPCLFVFMFVVLTTVTPASMATLRCVDEDLKPFALGFSWALFRLLGSIPGPQLVGFVLDEACAMWAGGMCDSDGFCMLYNNHDMAMGIMTWSIVVTGVASLFFVAASLFAMRLTRTSSYTIQNKGNQSPP